MQIRNCTIVMLTLQYPSLHDSFSEQVKRVNFAQNYNTLNYSEFNSYYYFYVTVIIIIVIQTYSQVQ